VKRERCGELMPRGKDGTRGCTKPATTMTSDGVMMCRSHAEKHEDALSLMRDALGIDAEDGEP